MKRTTEYYLKTIYLLTKKQGTARCHSIAETLGVSKPTVSIIVKRLINEGYAGINIKHEIFLTDTGIAHVRIGGDCCGRHSDRAVYGVKAVCRRLLREEARK